MSPVFSTLFVPAVSLAAAWTSATSLHTRRRLSGREARLRGSARLAFWAFALLLIRDHLVRTSAGLSAEALGLFTLPLLTLFLLALSAAVVRSERLKRKDLGLGRAAGRDFLAGIGVGAAIAFFGWKLGFIPRVGLVPSGTVGLLPFLAAHSLAAEIIFRGAFLKRFDGLLDPISLAVLSALLSSLCWLGLALFGPFPAVRVLTLAGWLSLSASALRLSHGLPAAVGLSLALSTAFLTPA